MVWVARSFTCMALVSVRSGQRALASVAKIPCKSPPKVGNARKWNAPDTKAGGGALRAYDLEPRMRGARPGTPLPAPHTSRHYARTREATASASAPVVECHPLPPRFSIQLAKCRRTVRPSTTASMRGTTRVNQGPVGVKFGRRSRRVILQFLAGEPHRSAKPSGFQKPAQGRVLCLACRRATPIDRSAAPALPVQDGDEPQPGFDETATLESSNRDAHGRTLHGQHDAVKLGVSGSSWPSSAGANRPKSSDALEPDAVGRGSRR